MKPEALFRHLARPARGTPLVFIITFSLGFTLADAAGILGLPLMLILLWMFFSYAYVLLDASAKGYAEPPVFGPEMFNPWDEPRPWASILLVGALYWAEKMLVSAFGGAIGAAFLGAALLLLPAAVGVMGVTRNLLQALNPVFLLKLIERLGVNYLIVWIVSGACVGLFWLSLSISLPILANAVAMYAVLAIFSIIGGAIFESRVVLGMPTERSGEQDDAREQAELDREHDTLVDEVYSLWRFGKLGGAYATLRKYLDRRLHVPKEYAWILPRLFEWEDRRLALRVANDHIARLVEVRQSEQALALVEQCLGVNEAFRPLTAAVAIRLARQAMDTGKRETASRLLADFAATYPDDPAIPVAAELARGLGDAAPVQQLGFDGDR